MNSNDRMRLIGITGGIGSGKSVVTDHLRREGFPVCDADEVAREAVRPGEPALQALIDRFGRGILCEDGTLNRPALAHIAFGSEENTQVLNSIMHGDIERRITAWLTERAAEVAKRASAGASHTGKSGIVSAHVPDAGKCETVSAHAINAGDRLVEKCESGGAVVFLSAPLLFEAGLAERCDEGGLVAADEDERVRRAAKRDGLTEEEIRARVHHQMPEAEKTEKADVVIRNDGTIDELIAHVNRLIGR
jgi:dephospho-CoA kinase